MVGSTIFSCLEVDDLKVGQAFVFLSAGFEVTAATLNLAFYELSKNPGMQERVREEINEKVREQGILSFDAFKDMTYLHMCLKETMRKYPPAQILFRNCTIEFTFRNGLVVKQGEKLIIPVFQFIAATSTTLNASDSFQKPCTFMPFGEGPRTCIAMRFALQQMKFCIAKILMFYRIKLNAKSKTPIELSKKTFITSTKDPLYFDLEKVTS
ncbi:cytochrome P450 6B1-like [Cimex lectularius]|uniref:Cytochrome P450 n=1 Tax=Cimex lectularius TaxID=79782 RepID=A0A8I6RTB7_CIMLE|nr:cytochrome P450 6B1-like [Cimex lectularius]